MNFKFKAAILFLLLVSSAISVEAQYRVSSVTRFSKLNDIDRMCSHKLNYDAQGQLISIDMKDSSPEKYIKGQEANIKSINIPVEYNKNEVKLVRDTNSPRVKHKLKIDKQGRIEKTGTIEIEYDKDGSIKKLKNLDSKYDVLYDEKGRMTALVQDKNNMRSNILIYYEKDSNLPQKMGVHRDSRRFISLYLLEWDGIKVKAINQYNVHKKLIRRHEFDYDTNDNLVEEKIYSNKAFSENDEIDLVLDKHFIISYDPEKGNDELYFKYSNWIESTLLGCKTFDAYTREYY